MCFYGNDILINVYDYIKDDFDSANFVTNKDYKYSTLKTNIQEAKNNNTLTHNIVLALDKTSGITKKEYLELIDMCEGNNIYIVTTTQEIYNALEDYDNVTVIDFSKELEENKSTYLMVDGKHLTEEGNKALAKLLKENLK